MRDGESIVRCITEQRECADYLRGDGPDRSGAMRGAEDWLMEEVILRQTLKAPFPWFGGKSRVAHLVWDRLGNVPNYVEPFAGSLAVLLLRPHDAKTETVNDADCLLANFWRALSRDPEAVAVAADWPVNEADLSARHQWLVNQVDFRERMKTDPEYYDCRVAGWWVWGLCQWIGSGWCANAGKGVHRQLPHLGNAGNGVHRKRSNLLDYFGALADRLRSVRVCCGDWSRVTGPSVTFKHGLTGVFLDPPYPDTADRSADLYSSDSLDVAHQACEWAIENGDNAQMRIAFCGYEGSHSFPDSWEAVRWKAHGGYGSQGNGKGRENADREVIWFSPHCLKPPSLFDDSTLECERAYDEGEPLPTTEKPVSSDIELAPENER